MRAEGGVSVEAALKEGLAWGLSWDDVDSCWADYSDLIMAADMARLLEITDTDPATDADPPDFTALAWDSWRGGDC